MEIIRRSERKETVEYDLYFERIEIPGAGFMFSCDENGHVQRPFETGPKQDSFEKAQDRTKYREPRVEIFNGSYVQPARVRCDCGREFDIPDFTNDCPFCGAMCNSFGQRLTPRQLWGEETNEHPADVDRPYAPGEAW